MAILAELDERLQLDEAIRRLAELGVAGAAVLGTIGKPAREAAEAARSAVAGPSQRARTSERWSGMRRG